jgi:CubicO group peptidase (beta-lactamase class C family)
MLMPPRRVNLRTRGALLLAALTVLHPHSARAQALDSAVIRRLDEVFADVATPTSPGCALAVTRAGAIAYAKGYGMAALEQHVPITPQTVFDLGSVSKQFTAASVLLLQLESKLSLDDDVRRYLPELPSLGATVTLRHLLTHTSGWRDYNDLLLMDGFDERDHTTDRDAWDTLRRQRALNFAPGATYRYSNTGYFLLGEVVKRVSGQSLAAFAHARIFAPLGMTRTQFLDDTRRVIPGRATAYSPDGTGFLVEMSNWDQVGDGAVQSTVEDLAKWEANFDSGRVGGPRLLALQLTPGQLNSRREIAYTAGLLRTNFRGVDVVSHTGAWAGFRASIARVPSAHLGVIITCNRADAGTATRSYRALDALLPLTAPRTIATAQGDATTGVFASLATGATLALETRGDTLFRVSGTQRMPYARVGPALFEDAWGTVRLRPIGERLVVTALGDVPDTLERAPRLGSLTPSRRGEYAGTYISPELVTPYRVTIVDSTLVLQRSHGDDIPLRPTSPDVFEAEGLATVRFVRDRGGRIVACTLLTRGVHALRLSRQGAAATR